MQENKTETQTIYIEQQSNHAEKTLKSVLADIDKTKEFLASGIIQHKGTNFKVESEKINAMFELESELKSDVVKYAYGKRIKNTATRELNGYLKAQASEE